MHSTGAIGMARKTNRLVTARTPYGRASRAGQDREFAPTQAKRLRDAMMRQVCDPEFGTELGILFLTEKITPSMYASGKRWREWAAKYQSAIGIFPVRSSTGERVGNSHPTDPDSDEGQKIAKREGDHAERYFEADKILVDCGPEVRIIVRRLCEDNEAVIGFQELCYARAGLTALAAHWNLTTAQKSPTNR